jgi:hypothetical protein
MAYLFQGDVTSRDPTSHWLVSVKGDQTLRFEFPAPVNVAKIRACATPEYPDRRTDYQIKIRNRTGVLIEVTGGFINTIFDQLGTWHTHKVQEENIVVIDFDLKPMGGYGACMKKIEIWTVE